MTAEGAGRHSYRNSKQDVLLDSGSNNISVKVGSHLCSSHLSPVGLYCWLLDTAYATRPSDTTSEHVTCTTLGHDQTARHQCVPRSCMNTDGRDRMPDRTRVEKRVGTGHTLPPPQSEQVQCIAGQNHQDHLLKQDPATEPPSGVSSSQNEAGENRVPLPQQRTAG